MEGYPKGNWYNPTETRVGAPSSFTAFQKALLWRIRYEAHSKTNFNVFAVLTRLGDIFPNYLLFMRWIMLKGKISKIDKERVILRAAWRMGCVYEWSHHVPRAVPLGITRDEIDSIAREESPEWTPRLNAIYRAVDELIEKKNLSDTQWKALTQHLSEDQCVELCMLVGHYIMIAITINTMGIAVEPEYNLNNSEPESDAKPKMA
jgi:4-carboxymuconolactone decarboxylase